MISCKMITHGRVHLLQEALYSFIIQDNEDCELIIVNDYPHQKIVFDHPRVKIYNIDTIFPTIGEKDNFAHEKCSGDIFAVWDDDDIAMPWHISNIKKYFIPGTNLLHWSKGVFYNEPNISGIVGIGNSGIVYSKEAWLKVGKSPIMNAGGDMRLVLDITALDGTKVVHAQPPNEEVSWFYRWATPQNYHQSGMGTDDGTRPDVVKRNHGYVEEQRKKGKIPTGEIKLIPHWRFDYLDMLRKYNKNESKNK